MPEPFTVLVFSKTKAFRHESIEAGIAAFQRLAEASKATEHPFVIEASEDAEAIFTSENLARYRVIVLLQTSGIFLTAEQINILEAHIKTGKSGVVGVHAALGAMKSAGDVDPTGYYGRLLGGVFTEHPDPQLGRVIIKAPSHPVVQPFLTRVSSNEANAPEPSFSHFDEWYNYQPTSCAVVTANQTPSEAATSKHGLAILLAADETVYEGGKHGENHPIAWARPDFEGSGTRVYYTALGHFAETYSDDVFVAHLNKAVLWAAKLL
ncbi:hypothetical protein SEUCBS139899_007370 [Sporothrix eucalyptigena]|uniref:ThuA-like domain-containing protein n=1 Tax=Sporothrix eucalyptigena TaxID=1812306 RepID=A0ABP0CF19_9PEZI